MTIAIDSATHIYEENMVIINNTSKPVTTLNKQSSVVCYHVVRESVTLGETLTAHITGTENPADLMTKVLSGGKYQYHAGNLLHDTNNNNMILIQLVSKYKHHI